jgi:uncharacterized RDD family membrane protein YckC
MKWYYVEQGQQAGPVEESQLEELRNSGRIQPSTLVWHEGMANWTPYSEARAGAGTASGAGTADAVSSGVPEAVCTECGKMFPADHMIRYGTAHVCVACKPIFLQKVAEGARIDTGEMRYAGFWIRLVAKFLDNLIVGIVVMIPFVIMIVAFAGSRGGASGFAFSPFNMGFNATDTGAELMANLFGVVFQFIIYGLGVLYSTFFLGKYGATPGKMICQLKVVDANGNKIGYGRALGRGAAEILSNIICSIGYIIAAFDGQKRTLHDHICNTRVVYK